MEDKAAALVLFIQTYTDERGYPPSRREMAEALGFRSVESITRLLKRLQQEQTVTWESGRARAIHIQ